MKFKFVILLMVLLVISLFSAYAGNERRSGTAGAQELLIPIGSRGTSMGGAVLATVSGVESMYWNPAGLASLEGTEVMFSHLPYFADININYIGLATKIEGFGTIGFGAKVVDIGEIEETTEERPDGTGRVFSPSLMVFNVSYAKVMTANVSFGFSTMYVYEDIFDVQATGLAFDAGFVYEPRWNGLSLGLTIKNYGGEMSFGGIGFDRPIDQRPLRPVNAKFDLPSSINIGFGYDFVNEGDNFASVSGAFQSNNYSQDAWYGGFEYVYDEKYSLRGGYQYSDVDDYLYGLTFGGGIVIPFGEASLGFNYTWQDNEVFDANQFFTVTANF
jgi:hypothetical protein